MKGTHVGIDIRVLADDGDAFAFIGVPQMCQDDQYFGEACSDSIKMSALALAAIMTPM